MGTVQILSSVAKQLLKNEKALWHGTGVSPQQLMEGAASTTPKFSSKFFQQGTGGMVQGPGLYATEIKPVAKHYANLVGGEPKTYTVHKSGAWPNDYVFSRIDPVIGGLEQHAAFNQSANAAEKLNTLAWLIGHTSHDLAFPASNKHFAKKQKELLSYLGDAKQSILTDVNKSHRLGLKADEDRNILLYGKIRNAEKEFSDMSAEDFITKTISNRYLYRVAFPKERYLDWYQPDEKDVKDILDAFSKETGMRGYNPGYFDSGSKLLNAIKIGNPADNISNTKVKSSEERIADVFEKAGFAGTKYRGDQQRGNFFNYVLQKPERARILDAFKFGAAGIAATPFLSQSKIQKGR